MKAVKYLATLVGLMVGGGLVGALVEFYRMPAWAMLSTLAICVVICAAVFYATNGMKRDLARIQCQLTGHWHAEFKKKYDDEAHCPRCKDLIRTKPPESDGPGMQVGEDTLHQRVVRLEAALGVKE